MLRDWKEGGESYTPPGRLLRKNNDVHLLIDTHKKFSFSIYYISRKRVDDEEGTS